MPAGSSARLFVALDLPAEVRDALVAWRAPVLAAAEGGLRAVDPAALHVTLCFLGSLPLASVEPVGEAVMGAIGSVGGAAGPHGGAPVPGVDVGVGGLALGDGLWLPRRRPRVLTVALEDGDGALAAVQAAVADALTAGGWFAPEPRRYLPHVTVARVRERRPAAAAALTRAPLPATPALAFAGVAVTLYRSLLGGGPARYEPLVRVALR
ncbi:2'-5' RNA ligase family protein [Conexibacter woesei]|uniref:RNA 2',3'-cyclic phosphodiesterase n=1 Tax=Conexibacter woesei (strain DSM 14684 / CCUG 47730 / CIP 108061 / JCM 11494 / NBRC 100937 / ID131577) TaxID=469383 RepID=D3FE47_CONWI|nr:2'-5' RNA ligase family protein [Conexibacter woesei]ADB51663.1 2'-5' RNA ligase [Conexibacter woesei DSM 14684]